MSKLLFEEQLSMLFESDQSINALKNLIGNPNSEEQLKDILKLLNDKQKKQLFNIVEQINNNNNNNNFLYHGTTNKIADDILKNGFKITSGKRSGFMGAEKNVQNQGIFLSDNKELAFAYGANRDKYDGKDTIVLKVIPKLYNIFDMTSWNKSIPNEIKKICLKTLSKYEGKQIKKPTQSDMFSLMDQPNVIESIKQLSFDAVKFSESRKTKKELNIDPDIVAHTFLVFNPDNLSIHKNKISNITDLFNYILERN